MLLEAAAAGDRGAFDRAYALLYEELMTLARAQRRRWVGDDTLGTSVLVHEAYLKLLGPDASKPEGASDTGPAAVRWNGRRHFFALAARVMRQVLVTYAERQHAAKRGGDARRVELEDVDGAPVTADAEWLGGAALVSPDEADQLLALHAALERLEARNERQARIVECRFFAGLPIPETAEVLGISPATVKREWQAARDWLHAELAVKE